MGGPVATSARGNKYIESFRQENFSLEGLSTGGKIIIG